MDYTLNAPSIKAGFGRTAPLQRLLAALTRDRSSTRALSVEVLRISEKATLRYTNLLGARIECLEGHVWVTLDGDCRDVVLRAGQSLLVDRQTPVLIHALEGACTRIRTKTI